MKRIISLVLSLIMVFSSLFTLASCSFDKDQVTITFNYNYQGAPKSEKQNVSIGASVEKPENPSRDKYIFTGWYSEKECKNIFVFTEPVNDKMTLYAGWLSENSEYVSNYIEMAVNNITIKFATGDNSNSVTENIELPKTSNEFDVLWESSDSDIITAEGKVTRPTDSNGEVILTATIAIGENSKSKQFSLKVIKGKEYSLEEVKDYSIDDLKELNKNNDYSLDIEYNEKDNATSILGNFSEYKIESKEDALWAIGNVRTIIGIDDPKKELKVASNNSDKFGTTYIFNQMVDGIEVYGRTVSITADDEGSSVSLNSSILDNNKLNKKISVSEDEIRNKLAKDLEKGTTISEINTVIYSLYEYENNPVVAYQVITNTEEIFFDTQDGNEIIRFSRIYTDKSLTGKGKNELNEEMSFPIEYKDWDWFFYYMMDTSRDITMYEDHLLLPNSRIGSEFNSWSDKTAISAYTNMITVFDWWAYTFERDSLDDNGMSVKVIVHDDSMTDNAFWSSSDQAIHFCDNSSVKSDVTTAGALDVIAHEYTHGIVEFTTGYLPYNNATGAINEAYADIFGCFVEGDWTVGEDWTTIRNIANPHKTDNPSEMFGEYYIDYTKDKSDYGGVHINSTIISHAAYLMGTYGITQSDLQNLWYLSLRQGYDATSDFYSVRKNVLKAARSLSFDHNKIEIIKRAFDEVNIKNDIPVADFSVPENIVITLGEINVIEPVIEPDDASDYTIKWSSSNESVATISPNGEAGIITTLAKGTTTITAELTSGGKTITKTTNLRVASKARDTVLVLDVSGSMYGEPIEEMKKSAIQFCNDLLKDEYNNRVGIVFYDDSITTIDLTNDLNMLISRIESIDDGGTTDMEAGLSAANSMLMNNSKDDTIKNVVVMADGLPNCGKTSHSGSMPSGSYSGYSSSVSYANAVIDTAKSMMNKYNLYSLGFFHGLYGEEKDFATALMKELTNQNDGYHQVDKAEDLQFAFGDISEEINIGSKIVINIACPVDVKVSFEGEMLSSGMASYCDATSFGTLQLIGKDKDIKVLSLDSDKEYNVELIGTGNGKMDYSVNYFDASEKLSDYRSFETVPITTTTIINSTTNNTNEVTLNIDEDGDGEVDSIWTALSKSKGTITYEKNPPEPEIPTEVETPVVEKEELPGWVIALIAVLSIFVLGGCVIIVVFATRKTKADDVEENDNEQIDIISSSASKENEKPKDYPVTDDIARVSGVIQVTNGSMNGFTIPVKDGEVLYLGKDAKIANLVFTNDYKNVSRIHCSVTFDAKTGKYYVTDCSSNGTYFISRKRLIKGKRTPVNINTVLLLANDECTILLN